MYNYFVMRKEMEDVDNLNLLYIQGVFLISIIHNPEFEEVVQC